MSAVQLPPENKANVRRSPRLRMAIEVMIIAQKASEKPTSEAASTLNIGVNGALIPLRMIVAVGDILTIINIQTQEEISCRVVDLESNKRSGMFEIGIEFTESAPKFWGVSFPPEGWSSRSPEAKGYIPSTNPLRNPTKKT